MASLTRPAVIWLLALVMPFQVLTAVYLDLRGPAHFHVENDDDDHDRDQDHGRAHDHGHGHTHTHSQDHVERHHHHADDPSVVTVPDDSLLELLALEAENKSGWSGTMLVALLGENTLPQLPAVPGGLTPRRETLPQSPFLGRLDRPPRTKPA